MTICNATHRTVTVERGSNILSGAEPQAVARCVAAAQASGRDRPPPAEYVAPKVSETVERNRLGHQHES